MKTLIKFFSLFLILFIVVGCSDDDNNELILGSKWEVESISDNESISVTNNTSDVFLPPIIYVNAWYKEGSVVLRCLSHEILFSLIAPNDNYISPEGHFSITKIDKQTLKIEFEHDSSGKPSYCEEIKIYGTNEETMITLLQIKRSFGELEPEI